MSIVKAQPVSSSDCEAITDTIISRAIEQMLARVDEEVIAVTYQYDDAARLYGTIAMLLTKKTAEISYIRYHQTLNCVHTFRVMTKPH